MDPEIQKLYNQQRALGLTPEAAMSRARYILARSRGGSEQDARAAAQAPVRIQDEIGPQRINPVAGVARALGQGISFNVGDEVVGALTGGRTREGRAEATQDYRNQLEQFRAQSPALAIGSEMAGAIPHALIPALQVPKGLSMLGQAGSRVATSRLAQAGGRGALEGTLHGMGSGQGDINQRLPNAAAGLAAGGVFGTTIPAVGEGLKFAGRAAKNVLLPTSPARADEMANRYLARLMNRAGDQPQDLVDRANAATTYDPRMMDLGEPYEGAARGAMMVPNANRGPARDFLGARWEGLPDQVRQSLTSTSGARDINVVEVRDALRDNLRKDAAPAYERAYENEFGVPRALNDPVLMRMLSHPVIRDAYETARETASIRNRDSPWLTVKSPFESLSPDLENRIGMRPGPTSPRPGTGALDDPRPRGDRTAYPGDPYGEAAGPVGTTWARIPTVEEIDMVKRGLDELVDKGFQGGTMSRTRARELKLLRNEIRDYVRERVPEYRDALNLYRGDMELMEALEAGKRFTNLDPREIPGIRADMTPGEWQMFRYSALDEVRNRLISGESADRTPGRIISSLQGERNQQRLRHLFDGDEQGFARFNREIQEVADQVGSTNRVLAGSRTAPANQDIRDLVEGAGVAPGFVGNLLAGRPATAARDALAFAVARTQGLDEQTAGAVTRKMIQEDPRRVLEGLLSMTERERERFVKATRNQLGFAQMGGLLTPSFLFTDRERRNQ